MGAYLSEPITSKDSEDGEGNRLKFGASSMQGWRVSQEDAHNCVGKLDENTSFFGVYDGHGGAEVAIYLSRHLPEFLRKNSDYINGNDMKKALHSTYLHIDESIKTNEGQTEIQLIAKRKNDNQEEVSGVDFEEENVCALYEEATMPLEALVAKYHSDQEISVPETSTEERPCSSKSILSPKLPKRKPGLQKEIEQPQPGGSTNGEKKEAKSNENGEIKITDVNTEVKDEAAVETKKNSNSEENNLKEVEVIKAEHKNGEHTESHESLKKEQNEISESEPAATESIEANHVNGEEKLETEVKIDSGPGGSSEKPEATKKAIDISDVTTDKEPVIMGSSAIAELGRIKRHIYQSLITPGDSDSEMSDSEEDDSFHIPKIRMGDDDEDSSDDEAMNSGTSNDEDDEVDEEEESEEDDEDDDFLNDSQEPGFDSGSTAVVALLKWEAETLHLWVANAGDSRCVVSRNGKALDMSKDHKPEEEGEARRIVQAGGKVTADGRVNGGLNLSRALGDHSYKQNKNVTPEEQMITPVPDVEHIVMDPQTDDFVILACDGIWNSMSSQQVVDFISSRLNTEAKLSKICEQLFDTCLARDTTGDGTGCDNMTAVIVRLEKSKTAKRELSLNETLEEEEEPKRVKLDTEVEEETKTST